ncbi:MAG: glyoxylate/hydroxypyruvate reductase A [Kordiimonadales bacterium]|nr:MAG: glyoxylate/hydroxypyruvate reductase A [Kordiimonadales bacterium]
MTRILFYLKDFPIEPWRNALVAEDASLEFRMYPDWGEPSDGPAYAVVWEPEPGLLKKFTNLKAVFSLGAGVDHLLSDPDLPEIPIIRMGDDGLKEGMAEYILMSVLMHHRQMVPIASQQRNAKWRRVISKSANKVRVGIMGYGALGKKAAEILRPIGYEIAAWSRRQKGAEEGIKHFTGPDAINAFLRRTDILVCLLPDTDETNKLLNHERLALLPKGASVINAGRGSLIDIQALIAHLDSDHLSGATLDVVPEEPLPADAPLWHHEKVIITPHVAAITRTDTGAAYIIRNIKTIDAGGEPENKLDRNHGY